MTALTLSFGRLRERVQLRTVSNKCVGKRVALTYFGARRADAVLKGKF